MGFRSPLDDDSDDNETATATASKLAEQAKKRAAKKTASKPPTPQVEEEQNDASGADEDDSQENQNSGQPSGNPENQNSRNLDDDDGETAQEKSFDYLGAVYGGITDPYEDFVKGSTQLPLCTWRALKAAAAMEGTSVQRLLTDIVLGRKEPLPKLQPEIETRFYTMAQQGKLRR